MTNSRTLAYIEVARALNVVSSLLSRIVEGNQPEYNLGALRKVADELACQLKASESGQGAVARCLARPEGRRVVALTLREDQQRQMPRTMKELSQRLLEVTTALQSGQKDADKLRETAALFKTMSRRADSMAVHAKRATSVQSQSSVDF